MIRITSLAARLSDRLGQLLSMIRKLLLAVLLLAFTGCGPAFSPQLLSKCSDMMLPDSMGLHGPLPPEVGGAANQSGERRWSGKILLATTPANASQSARVHPAMARLEENLKASNDEEVSAVGYVLEYRQRNGGFLRLTVLDWKDKIHLGDWTIAKWSNKVPEKADFESNYPKLLAKVKELHR